MKKKKKNSKGQKTSPSHQRCGPGGAAQVVDGVYISGEYFATNKELLMNSGIRSIVACGCNAHHQDDFRYMRIRSNDHVTANVGRHLNPASDFIAQSLRHGAVLVHCKAGICRSATMIAAYLLKYRQDLAPTVGDALAVIRKSRPCANPRPVFVEALQQFSHQVSWLNERSDEEQGEEQEEDASQSENQEGT